MKKIRQNNFGNCPKKGVKRDAIYFVNSLKVFLKMMKQKRPRKKVRNSKKIKIKKKKFGQVFFYLIFRNCPQKGTQGDAEYILRTIKVFLKRMKQKRLHKVHPPSEQRGTLILFNLIECGRLSFHVSPFLKTGIERQHQYLSYKLLNTSVTSFLHIELRDSHSIPNTPCTCKKV